MALGRVTAPKGAYDLLQTSAQHGATAIAKVAIAAAPKPKPAITAAGNPDDIGGMPRAYVVGGAAIIGLGIIAAIAYKMRHG